MDKTRTFIKECKDPESAVEFEKKVNGKRTTNVAVTFQGTYSVSKALYNVKTDMYRVYIRVRPLHSDAMFTFIVSEKTSKEAYNEARKKVQKGVF
ncbi:hypothetical protein [uncultured Robinsoniella sp.]|uniref:hypothetical protein n=1 Tax=uncultured Robinsoniella sp. TaxID=904190 RepID=UPI00374FD89E